MSFWNPDEGFMQSMCGGNNMDDSVNRKMMEKDIETGGGYYAKVRGDVGEVTLSSVLKSLPDYYHVMNNILLKTKKGSTQIDHVIVSPFGIFVVETKNYKGMIFGDCFGRVWTQVLQGRGHFTLYNPVAQNAGHIKHLSAQTRIPEQFMQGVICFTDSTANLENVNCPYCFNVSHLYDFIMAFQQPLFTERLVWQIIERIDKINKSSYINDMKHVAYVKSIKDKRGY